MLKKLIILCLLQYWLFCVCYSIDYFVFVTELIILCLLQNWLFCVSYRIGYYVFVTELIILCLLQNWFFCVYSCRIDYFVFFSNLIILCLLQNWLLCVCYRIDYCVLAFLVHFLDKLVLFRILNKQKCRQSKSLKLICLNYLVILQQVSIS